MRSTFSSLMLIELRQCLYWLLVLVLMAVTFGLILIDPSFSTSSFTRFTWPIFSSLTVIGPLVAAFGAWVGSRSRRTGVLEMLRVSHLRLENIPIELTLIVLIPVFLSIFGLISLLFVRPYSWGPPRILLWPLGVSSLIALGCVGYSLGYLWPNRFTPLVAVVVAYLPAVALSAFGRPDTRQWDVILPRSIPEVYPSEIRSGDTTLFGWLLVWFLGLALTAISLVVMSKRPAGSRIGLTILLIILTVIGANRAIAADARPYDERTTLIPFHPVCETLDAVSYCVHPVNRDTLSADTKRLNRLVAPVQQIPEVPRAFAANTVRPGSGSAAVIVPVIASEPAQFAFGTALRMIRGIGPGQAARFGVTPTASEVVIACWLTQEYGAVCPLIPGGTAEAARIRTSDPANAARAITGLDQQIRNAISRFQALSATDQDAWLANHWSALGQGTVTLDQLP